MKKGYENSFQHDAIEMRNLADETIVFETSQDLNANVDESLNNYFPAKDNSTHSVDFHNELFLSTGSFNGEEIAFKEDESLGLLPTTFFSESSCPNGVGKGDQEVQDSSFASSCSAVFETAVQSNILNLSSIKSSCQLNDLPTVFLNNDDDTLTMFSSSPKHEPEYDNFEEAFVLSGIFDSEKSWSGKCDSSESLGLLPDSMLEELSCLDVDYNVLSIENSTFISQGNKPMDMARNPYASEISVVKNPNQLNADFAKMCLNRTASGTFLPMFSSTPKHEPAYDDFEPFCDTPKQFTLNASLTNKTISHESCQIINTNEENFLKATLSVEKTGDKSLDFPDKMGMKFTGDKIEDKCGSKLNSLKPCLSTSFKIEEDFSPETVSLKPKSRNYLTETNVCGYKTILLNKTIKHNLSKFSFSSTPKHESVHDEFEYCCSTPKRLTVNVSHADKTFLHESSKIINANKEILSNETLSVENNCAKSFDFLGKEGIKFTGDETEEKCESKLDNLKPCSSTASNIEKEFSPRTVPCKPESQTFLTGSKNFCGNKKNKTVLLNETITPNHDHYSHCVDSMNATFVCSPSTKAFKRPNLNKTFLNQASCADKTIIKSPSKNKQRRFSCTPSILITSSKLGEGNNTIIISSANNKSKTKATQSELKKSCLGVSNKVNIPKVSKMERTEALLSVTENLTAHLNYEPQDKISSKYVIDPSKVQRRKSSLNETFLLPKGETKKKSPHAKSVGKSSVSRLPNKPSSLNRMFNSNSVLKPSETKTDMVKSLGQSDKGPNSQIPSFASKPYTNKRQSVPTGKAYSSKGQPDKRTNSKIPSFTSKPLTNRMQFVPSGKALSSKENSSPSKNRAPKSLSLQKRF